MLVSYLHCQLRTPYSIQFVCNQPIRLCTRIHLKLEHTGGRVHVLEAGLYSLHVNINQSPFEMRICYSVPTRKFVVGKCCVGGPVICKLSFM